MRLKDERALITGGSTGIGLATARAFLDEGSRVITCGHHERRPGSRAGSSISKHLGELLAVGAVRRAQEGNFALYAFERCDHAATRGAGV